MLADRIVLGQLAACLAWEVLAAIVHELGLLDCLLVVLVHPCVQGYVTCLVDPWLEVLYDTIACLTVRWSVLLTEAEAKLQEDSKEIRIKLHEDQSYPAELMLGVVMVESDKATDQVKISNN